MNLNPWLSAGIVVVCAIAGYYPLIGIVHALAGISRAIRRRRKPARMSKQLAFAPLEDAMGRALHNPPCREGQAS